MTQHYDPLGTPISEFEHAIRQYINSGLGREALIADAGIEEFRSEFKRVGGKMLLERRAIRMIMGSKKGAPDNATYVLI